MASPDPKDVAAPFGLDSSHLNKPCTEAFFLSFSDHVHPWRLVFAHLLSQTDLDDVDSEHSSCSEKEKRIASLRKWKTRRGNEATFRAIIEAVLSTDNVDSAESLCKIIAGRKTELSQDQPLTTVDQPSEKSVAMTRTNEEKIRAQFIALVQRVQDAIKASSDVEVVRNYLTMFFKCDLPDTTEMHKLFEAVSLQNLWNYQHHSPLESVADHFLSGNQEIERSIREYKARLSGFYVATKLVDFIESKKLRVDDDDDESDDPQPPALSPKQYRRLKIILKLERKITKLSLEYVHKLWSSFAEEYDIPSLTVVLEKVESGSLVITWLIPTHLVDKIVPRSKFFRDHGIVQVFLDGQSIYDEEEMAAYEKSFLELCLNMATADSNSFSFFLKKGIDPNIFDTLGKHPLFYVTNDGRQDLAELLIEHGADVDLATKDEDGDTPLITAVCSRNYEMVELLLLKGAKINKTNKEGCSPHWLASNGGQSDIASLLLQHHAEVDLPRPEVDLPRPEVDPPTDGDNEGAFLELCLNMATANINLFSFFLKKGIDLNIFDKLGKHPLFYATNCGRQDLAELLIEHGADVDLATEDGDTPLITAVRSGNYQMVQLLLLKGAKVNETNKGGQPPLYGASFAGHVDIAKLLVSRGADVDKRCDDNVTVGTTPLIVACDRNHLEVASFLIENGANVNLQTKDENLAPLHIVSQYGHTALVKQLLESGAQLEIKNKKGRTPLMVVSWTGRLETVVELLRAGALANTQDQEGLTSLMLASQNAHLEVVEALLKAKADPDITENTAGWSAVFFAAKSGCLEIVQQLLRGGARVDIRDKNGLTPDEVTDQQDICEEIKRHSLRQREAIETCPQEETQDNTNATPSESEGESRDQDEVGKREVTDEQEKIDADIQEQSKAIEEERKRDMVEESYRRLLEIFDTPEIFDVLEDSLLGNHKEKKLYPQINSNVYEDDQELAFNDQIQYY